MIISATVPGAVETKIDADNNTVTIYVLDASDMITDELEIKTENNAPVANVEDQTVEGYEAQKHPKFEIYADKAGEFRFRLKAKNGEIIAVSEGYKAMASCVNGIESVKKNAVDAEIVEE